MSLYFIKGYSFGIEQHLHESTIPSFLFCPRLLTHVEQSNTTRVFSTRRARVLRWELMEEATDPFEPSPPLAPVSPGVLDGL
jgi:hypothetical protein